MSLFNKIQFAFLIRFVLIFSNIFCEEQPSLSGHVKFWYSKAYTSMSFVKINNLTDANPENFCIDFWLSLKFRIFSGRILFENEMIIPLVGQLRKTGNETYSVNIKNTGMLNCSEDVFFPEWIQVVENSSTFRLENATTLFELKFHVDGTDAKNWLVITIFNEDAENDQLIFMSKFFNRILFEHLIDEYENGQKFKIVDKNCPKILNQCVSVCLNNTYKYLNEKNRLNHCEGHIWPNLKRRFVQKNSGCKILLQISFYFILVFLNIL